MTYSGINVRGFKRHSLRTLILVPALLLVAPACQEGDSGQDDIQARCDQVIADLMRCYPDLEAEGECTADTLALYESYDISELECTAMDDIGKADVFAFEGCGPNEHVCGYIFCCDDYVVTSNPTDTDWDIIELIDDYQAGVPADVSNALDGATRSELMEGTSWTWEQDVVSGAGRSSQPMAVELSVRLIEVPYEDFVERLAPADWGVNLAEYLGGEVIVYDEDELSRPTAQVERMVLGAFPCEMDTRLGNMDMTKAEWIYYYQDGAKVYWRVYFSDNDSVEADVGTLELWSYDPYSTLVIFHSAHRLNTPLGTHISNDIVEPTLRYFFLRYIEKYRQIVGG